MRSRSASRIEVEELAQRPRQDARDRHARIERAVGILEDDLDALAHRSLGAAAGASGSSGPSKRISPRLGSCRPAMQRPSVVLPLPLSPTMARQLPLAMSNETPFTTVALGAGQKVRRPR